MESRSKAEYFTLLFSAGLRLAKLYGDEEEATRYEELLTLLEKVQEDG